MKRIFAIIVLLTSYLFASEALAQKNDVINSEQFTVKKQQVRERIFGIGTAFGGGFQTVQYRHSDQTTPHIDFPTLELSIFLNYNWSINIIIPIINMFVSSDRINGIEIWGDTLLNTNLGNGRAKFVAGIGLGFDYSSWSAYSGALLRIPAQIGVEVLSNNKNFGVQFLTRGSISIGSLNQDTIFGYSLTEDVVFNGYIIESFLE